MRKVILSNYLRITDYAGAAGGALGALFFRGSGFRLKDGGWGDPQVAAALQQIKDLHRNPLIHPEVAIDTEEAITVLGLAGGVIAEMLKVLPDEEPTTLSAV